MLRADSVSFRYQASGVRRQASAELAQEPAAATLSDVSIDVGKGRVVGILGPNGSGKTTLLRMLCGMRHPDRGRVTLEGTSLDRISRRALARRIAVVPQETQLAFEYTVLEMVLMGRHPHLGLFQLEGPTDFDVARDALAATGTAPLEHRRFSTLSGGEKQRVVIAAALAQAADIMLLDEPTASLDLGYQLEVAALATSLNRERGVTIVISTHDLNLAASTCHELVMLRQGRVIAAGPTTDILTPANVRELYDVDADVHVHEPSGHLIVVPVTRVTRPR